MIWGWTLWPSVIKKLYIRYLSKLSFRVSIPTSVCGLELGKSWPQVPKLCESWRVSILQQIRQTCSVKQRVFWTAVCCLFVGLVTKLCPTLVTPWTVACQAPLPMGYSRQEYWSGLPFLSPGDRPDPGIEPESPALQQILYWLSYEGSPLIASLVLQLVKNPPEMQKTPVWFLGREDLLEKATHCNILALPWWLSW